MTDRLMSQSQCDVLYTLWMAGAHRGNEYRMSTADVVRASGLTKRQVGQALYGLYCREFVRQDQLSRWYPSPVCSQIWGIAGDGNGDDEVPL